MRSQDVVGFLGRWLGDIQCEWGYVFGEVVRVTRSVYRVDIIGEVSRRLAV